MDFDPRKHEDQNYILTNLNGPSGYKEGNWKTLLRALEEGKKVSFSDSDLLITEELSAGDIALLKKMKIVEEGGDPEAMLGYASHPLYDIGLAIHFYNMYLRSKNSYLSKGNFWKYEYYYNQKLFGLRSNNRDTYQKFIRKLKKYYYSIDVEDNLGKLIYKHQQLDKSVSLIYRDFYMNNLQRTDAPAKVRKEKLFAAIEIYKKYFEQEFLYFFLVNFERVLRDSRPMAMVRIKKDVKKRYGQISKGNMIEYIIAESPSKKFTAIVKPILNNKLRNLEAHEDYRITTTHVESKTRPYKITHSQLFRTVELIEEFFWSIVYLSRYHFYLERSNYDFLLDDPDCKFKLTSRKDNIHNRGTRSAVWWEEKGKLHISVLQYAYATYHIKKPRKSDLTKVIIGPAPLANASLVMLFQWEMIPSGISITENLENEIELFKKYDGQKITVHMQPILPKISMPGQDKFPIKKIQGFEYMVIDNEHTYEPVLNSASLFPINKASFDKNSADSNHS